MKTVIFCITVVMCLSFSNAFAASENPAYFRANVYQSSSLAKPTFWTALQSIVPTVGCVNTAKQYAKNIVTNTVNGRLRLMEYSCIATDQTTVLSSYVLKFWVSPSTKKLVFVNLYKGDLDALVADVLPNTTPELKVTHVLYEQFCCGKATRLVPAISKKFTVAATVSTCKDYLWQVASEGFVVARGVCRVFNPTTRQYTSSGVFYAIPNDGFAEVFPAWDLVRMNWAQARSSSLAPR